MIFAFDIEVFKYDWLIVFKNISTGEYTEIHNDSAALRKFMSRDKMIVGFNNKHYDNFIIKAILCGADTAMIKEINDYIIGGKQGFDHWFLKQNSAWFESFDIRDDVQMGLSLKAIEGHLGLNIIETEIPFDIDRLLTEDEIISTFKYCAHDVDTAEKLVKIRKPYLDGKMSLGRLKEIPDEKSLYSTNAKITAMFLSANPQKHTDERMYTYPENLNKSLIPAEIISFFDKMHDETISDDKLFKSKLSITVGGCEFVYGFGGVHGAIPTYQESATDQRVIINQDVASLYPSLMILYGYTSRNIPSAELYEKVYRDRLAAKKAGDKQTADSLKLCLNTTYGAMLNKYNPLFDPRMGRAVCISGQLFLTELAVSLINGCPTLKVINFNTDGILYSIDKTEANTAKLISKDWETRTGFVLEDECITKIVQKDVNNYIIIHSDGSLKKKGGYLNYGMSAQGVWNINNNGVIIKKAICDYFVNGTPVEETINNCDDIFQFQFIAKAGIKYREAFHLIDGVRIPIQKVNRVYATPIERYGTLTKVKVSEDDDEDEKKQKIESLPEHCIIDNDNQLTIADIDKSHYSLVAQNRINDFLGIKTEKILKGRKTKMAEKNKPDEPVSFLNKLFQLQCLMDGFTWSKDGKNTNQQYKYITEAQYKENFKLARREAGLLWTCVCKGREYIPHVTEKMHLIVAEFEGKLTDPDTGEFEVFPFVGSGADNGDKALYKAYTGGLKFFLANQYLVAEGTEPEDDSDEPTTAKAESVKAKSKPATAEERTEAKEVLTDGPASKLQISALKNALKKLREVDETKESFIADIAAKTESFTKISKAACEKLIIAIGGMIESVGT